MSGINTEHTIHLKVLTPVHIGGAQEKHLQEDLDTLFYDGMLWKIDWKKMYKTFSAHELSDALIKADGLYALLGDDVPQYATEYSEGYGDTKEIKALIRDGFGRTLLPGSSLKGAIKNWLYSSYDSSRNGTRNLFGNFETDLFRFIRPSDCYLTQVKVFPVKLFNLFSQGNNWLGGWKHNRQGGTNSYFEDKGFVTDFECFNPGQTVAFTMRISKELPVAFKESLYDKEIAIIQGKIASARDPLKIKKLKDQKEVIQNGKNAQMRFYQHNPLLELFNSINKQIQKHLEKEYSFFSKYKTEYSENVLSEVEKLLASVTMMPTNQCLLRLSAGSGFHGMSGDYQFEDHDKTGVWEKGRDAGKKKYKSRKIAFTPGLQHFYPMGFVLLSTQPFVSGIAQSDATKTNDQEKAPTSIVVKPQSVSSLERQYADASVVHPGDIIFGEILQLGKPFHTVKLLLSNYPFEGIADLSGVKGHSITVGQTVRCKLQLAAKTGEYKMVAFIP